MQNISKIGITSNEENTDDEKDKVTWLNYNASGIIEIISVGISLSVFISSIVFNCQVQFFFFSFQLYPKYLYT